MKSESGIEPSSRAIAIKHPDEPKSCNAAKEGDCSPGYSTWLFDRAAGRAAVDGLCDKRSRGDAGQSHESGRLLLVRILRKHSKHAEAGQQREPHDPDV